MSVSVDIPACADMCRHMPTCADICRHVLTCADKCRHVPTCDINHDTSDSDHLDLNWVLACVSVCGHAGMCLYVPTCAGM